MEMPSPTDPHRKLHRIAGNWVGDERMHPPPWDPKGGMAVGRVHNRIALDGYVVIQDYEQERDGDLPRTWNLHGARCRALSTLYWFDSVGVPPNIFKGRFENNILTLTSEGAQGYTRTVFDFTQEKRYQFRMEV